MPLPTLDDFKRHLNESGTADDAELSDVLAAARDVTESIVGPLTGKTITETHRGVRSDVLLLRQRPVAALTSVSFRSYAGWEPVSQSLADFDLDPDAGLLRLASGHCFSGDVAVTYTAGFDTVPQSVWLATLIIGKSLWETQRGAQPLPLQAQDAADTTFDTPYFAPGIPERARVLLEPFARGPQVA